jgi:hypothetical protein
MRTCEAVISEACCLLSGNDLVMQLIQRQIISIPFRLDDNIQPVRKLLSKYGSVPIALADACLVRMSELYQNSSVFTLDSDFKIYRKEGRRTIPTIAP